MSSCGSCTGGKPEPLIRSLIADTRYRRLKDNQDLILEACKKDLGKPSFETYLTEVGWCMNDIVFMSKNLARFAKDEPAQDMNLTNKFFGPKIRKDPLGSALIIG